MRFRSMTTMILGLLLTAAAFGEDWPQWRGPKRDAISTETGLLQSWPDGGPKMLWKVSGLGVGYASASIANGVVYTTGLINDQGWLFAFDTKGKLLWKMSYGPEFSNRRAFPGSRTTPTIDGGDVFLVSGMGDACRIDAKTGKLRWSVNILKRFDGHNITWGISESPLVVGDKVICTPGGKKGAVVALNRETGATVWAMADVPGPAAYCSALLIERGGKKIVTTIVGNNVVGVDLETGKLLWSVRHGRKTIHPNTPVYHDGKIYVTSGYGMGGTLIALSADGTSAKKVWDERKLDCHHGGVVLVGGRIYGSGHKNRGWFCLDFLTGRILGRDSKLQKGSVIYADGRLYCLGEKFRLSLVKPLPNGYEVVSSFSIPRKRFMSWAHPALSDGVLYIRNMDELYAFDVKAK